MQLYHYPCKERYSDKAGLIVTSSWEQKASHLFSIVSIEPSEMVSKTSKILTT